MTITPYSHQELFRRLLDDEGGREVRYFFAREYDLHTHHDWCGIDVAVYARILSRNRGRTDLVEQFDQSAGSLWLYLANELTTKSPHEQRQLCMTSWVRSLEVLTERFPAPAIMNGFTKAMIHLGSEKPLKMNESPSAPVFTRVWNHTFDRVDEDVLRLVLTKCRNMFLPGDYCVGYFHAWRCGVEMVLRYVQVLRSTMNERDHELPVLSTEDMDKLKHIVASVVSQNKHNDYEALFVGLDGPLKIWGEWLDTFLFPIPD